MIKYLFSVVCASLLASTAMAQYRPAYVPIQNRPVVQNRLYLNYNFNSFNSFGNYNYNPYYNPTYSPFYNQLNLQNQLYFQNLQQNSGSYYYNTPEYLRWRFLTYGF